MKAITYCIILSFCILASGCVRRTVTESKVSPSPNSSNVSETPSKVVDEKTIWFWQDGFRQP